MKLDALHRQVSVCLGDHGNVWQQGDTVKWLLDRGYAWMGVAWTRVELWAPY